MWFVGFCFLTNQWQVSNPDDNPLNEGADAARAAITFSFFSIFTWVSTTFYTVSDSKLQQGKLNLFFLFIIAVIYVAVLFSCAVLNQIKQGVKTQQGILL